MDMQAGTKPATTPQRSQGQTVASAQGHFALPHMVGKRAPIGSHNRAAQKGYGKADAGPKINLAGGHAQLAQQINGQKRNAAGIASTAQKDSYPEHG